MFSEVTFPITAGNSHPQVPNLMDPLERRSFSWVCDMSQVAPGFDDIDPRALLETPPIVLVPTPPATNPFSILSQVIIDRGELSTQRFTPTLWDYDQTLSGKPYRQIFAHRVALTMRGLLSAKVIATSFDHPFDRTVLDLGTPTDGEIVKIQIANSCDDNPLQWEPFPPPVPDEDSKWFFELLSDSAKDNIKQQLGPNQLPIPRPVPLPQGLLFGPGSANCIPIRTKAASYTL